MARAKRTKIEFEVADAIASLRRVKSALAETAEAGEQAARRVNTALSLGAELGRNLAGEIVSLGRSDLSLLGLKNVIEGVVEAFEKAAGLRARLTRQGATGGGEVGEAASPLDLTGQEAGLPPAAWGKIAGTIGAWASAGKIGEGPAGGAGGAGYHVDQDIGKAIAELADSGDGVSGGSFASLAAPAAITAILEKLIAAYSAERFPAEKAALGGIQPGTPPVPAVQSINIGTYYGYKPDELALNDATRTD